jgi:tetratricopeptide (TPR) repeat protein
MFLSVHVPRSASPGKRPQRWSGLLKTIGAVSAALSFLLVLNQVTGVLQDFRIHHKEFREAMKIGDQAQERQDYPAAFASFKHAVELDPIDRKAQDSETKAAMLWLENAETTQNQTFTDIVSQILPVLDRALANAKGQAAADILAHMGWADFLRYREGTREGPEIEQSLQRAITIDKNNPYAQVMSGFWVLWQGGSVDSADGHFAAALASGRERAYVRSLQIAALINSCRKNVDVALLRVANEMRKNGEPLSHSRRAEVLECTIGARVRDRDKLVTALSALPPAEMLSTYDWLYDGYSNSWDDNKGGRRQFVEANLDEIAGYDAQALPIYKSLQKSLAGTRSAMVVPVNEAIKRIAARAK